MTAFIRSNKGVTVTREGEELLSFARMLLGQSGALPIIVVSRTSLRMVQLYEQRKQDIRKAEAQTLVNLSRVLGCGVEDLFE